ncbi:unnamed protein product [Diatraea saccharalis]|uniref:DUF7921 domain-containing protein n=1 Tax=Diatraea saccharalis TaxID=40085 RepID=A0A9N9WLW0_9NEOP|nr:unnamed protein product [Diatraea saccharalis]
MYCMWLQLYRSAELAECTDLCVCEASLQVSCKVACVPRAPCSSRLAHYSHAAPAYQAYRGRCYCYSGSFICMRPNPGEYTFILQKYSRAAPAFQAYRGRCYCYSGSFICMRPKPGEYTFTLQKYSRAAPAYQAHRGRCYCYSGSAVDEALLRPHTGLGAEDAVRLLQQYLYSVHNEGTNCTLSLFNISNENVIISASVPQKEQESLREAGDGEALLDREKEECIDVLKVVKSRINSQHEDISSHLLLSIFKIAEVDVVYPAPPSSAITNHEPLKILYIIITIFSILYNITNTSIDKTIVNFISNLFDHSFSKKLYFSSDVIIFDEIYIFNEFVTILNDEFMKVVELEKHDALASLSAQNTERVDLSVIDVNNYKETIHIINAVNITILIDNFNVLVADAIIIPKYFSRDVYYDNGCTKSCDSEMLFDLCFGNNASSSYGIMRSVSLGLTLVVE